MTGHARISLAAWGATVLGAMVLTPVFSGPFLFISAFLCALVTGVGVLLQNLRAPRIVVPIVQLVVLVELLSLFFLHDTMKFGVLPLKATALEFNAQMVDALNRLIESIASTICALNSSAVAFSGSTPNFIVSCRKNSDSLSLIHI